MVKRPPGSSDAVRRAHALGFGGSHAASRQAYVAAFVELLAPGVEVIAEDETSRGLAETRRLLERTAAAWDELRLDLRGLSDLADGRVLASGRALGRGAGDGERVELPFAAVWTLKAGRVVRIESFCDRDDAQQALAAGSEPATASE